MITIVNGLEAAVKNNCDWLLFYNAFKMALIQGQLVKLCWVNA
jgi:hypothetical protein